MLKQLLLPASVQVRSTGEEPSTEEVVRVARLFEDDLTLENLTRPQLVSMCRLVQLRSAFGESSETLTQATPDRYMNINAFGTDIFLRYTIRNRLTKLKEDDRVSLCPC